MATILGNNAENLLVGRSGSDTIIGKAGNDTIVGNANGGANLLIDGSFETASTNSNTWGTKNVVGGWRTDTSIEVWGKDFLGVKATNGDKIVELDFDTRFSRLWQDVTTEEGKIYDFSFDFAARKGTTLATNSVEVYWNNNLVGTFDPKSTIWQTGKLSLAGTGGTDRLEFREQAGDNDSLGGLIDNVSLKTRGTGYDVLIGGAGNDDITGQGGDDMIYGGSQPVGGNTTPSATHVTTAADNDVIRAGNGNDIAYGNNGDDQIYGESGNDILSGGRGDDLVDGGTGSDTLRGNSGNDVLSDGSGNDHVSGDSGNDTIRAGSGDDTYVGGTGIDMLDFFAAETGVKVDLSKHTATGMGYDKILGIEQISGSSFDDALKGSKFDDVLSGAGGNDVLRGRGGADVLSGGEGSDTFIWKITDLKQQVERGEVDRVLDFSKEDHLDLHDLTVGMSIDSLESVLTVKDDGQDSHVYVNLGGGFQEIAVLENFSGYSVNDMVKDGMITL